tara:strand:- start:118 stop:396 length:279 start_codon:yes stop_codon:yes gene_type:complete
MKQSLITDWFSSVSNNQEDPEIDLEDNNFVINQVDDGYETPDELNVIDFEESPSPSSRDGVFGLNVLNHRHEELLQNPLYDGYNEDSMNSDI